jgi:hypothetical protein
MHLGDEEIQRVLHGEIESAVRGEALEHLDACSSCRQRLDDAGREEAGIYALLSHVDHPVPEVHPQSLMVARSAAPTGGWRRKAALIALAVGGAGVAYAAPGSPLPGWINRIGAIMARHAAAPAVPTAPSPSESTPSGGIAVTPHDRFTIGFTSVQTSGTATVILTDGHDIIARSANGTATFMTDVDRLTISNEASAADYEIQVPRGAPWVEIRVAARRLLLKRGAEVLSDVPADTLGRYVLSLTRSER